VTLEELRIECSFPADEATAEVCRELGRPTRTRCFIRSGIESTALKSSRGFRDSTVRVR
jgi:hypothetical protein